MKIIEFKRYKFIQLLKKLGLWLSVGLTFFIVVVGLVYGLSLLLNNLNDDIFALKSVSDFLLVSLWLISGIVSIVYIVIIINRKMYGEGKKINQLFAVFSGVIFLATLIPSIFTEKKASAKAVEAVVSNTYWFYYVLFGLLIIGFLSSLICIKSDLQKSNWFAFLIALPYIFVGWGAQRAYESFRSLVTMDSFKNQIVAEMINASKGELRYINSYWYDLFGIMLISVTLFTGVKISEIVWKKIKTKNARKA